MLFKTHLNVKIARCCTGRACLSFARQTNLITFVYTSRYLDLQRFGFLNTATPTTVTTGRGDHRPFTSALGTGLLNREKSLLHTHLSLTTTGGTSTRRRARPRTRSATGLTADQRGHPNTGLRTSYGIFQGKIQRILQIAAAIRTSPATGAAEDVAKNITKNITKPSSTGTATHAR